MEAVARRADTDAVVSNRSTYEPLEEGKLAYAVARDDGKQNSPGTLCLLLPNVVRVGNKLSQTAGCGGGRRLVGNNSAGCGRRRYGCTVDGRCSACLPRRAPLL